MRRKKAQPGQRRSRSIEIKLVEFCINCSYWVIKVILKVLPTRAEWRNPLFLPGNWNIQGVFILLSLRLSPKP